MLGLGLVRAVSTFPYLTTLQPTGLFQSPLDSPEHSPSTHTNYKGNHPHLNNFCLMSNLSKFDLGFHVQSNFFLSFLKLSSCLLFHQIKIYFVIQVTLSTSFQTDFSLKNKGMSYFDQRLFVLQKYMQLKDLVNF